MEVYNLERETIAQNVARKLIGNYWLGDFSPDGSLIVRYIGRSLTCIRNRLYKHAYNSEFEGFIWRPADTVREAFMIECREYHLCDNLTNKDHPNAPRHLPYSCPYPFCDHNKNTKRGDA